MGALDLPATYTTFKSQPVSADPAGLTYVGYLSGITHCPFYQISSESNPHEYYNQWRLSDRICDDLGWLDSWPCASRPVESRSDEISRGRGFHARLQKPEISVLNTTYR